MRPVVMKGRVHPFGFRRLQIKPAFEIAGKDQFIFTLLIELLNRKPSSKGGCEQGKACLEKYVHVRSLF
ncbi:hypothetical protein CHU94_12370 [Rhodoferax sp. TH121]|nr:hypothetical protein CHU94_12370 [Rhodoferax sp. TH121]